MFDAKTNLSNQVVDEVRKHFPDQVYASVIPRNVRLAECSSFGKPIVLYDPNSKGCSAYLSLANEFLARNQEIEMPVVVATKAGPGLQTAATPPPFTGGSAAAEL